MKVASVSFWHLHGTDYATDAQNSPDLELVALWDDDAERGAEGARRYGIVFEPDLDVILDDKSIEGVIVCAPTSEHADIVIRCIRAGKHVFMEKVLSADLPEARAIVTAARDQDAALTVSLWRSDKGYAAQIAELVASGLVGTVTSARIRDGHPFALPMTGHPDGLLPARFYDPSTTCGGVLIDLCHPLYLLAMILGLPVRVATMFGHVTGHEVEDNAAVLLSYASGAIAIAETSSVTRITPFTIEIHGTEGSILYSEPGIGALVAAREGHDGPELAPDDVPRLRYRSINSPENGWQQIDVAPDAPTAITQWVRHAQTGSRGRQNNDLAIALTALVRAAYDSARHGEVVAVQPCD
ncbi:MAG TPA: Gfo/Idh/MocA family oxidoreductase [Glaciibacter sp.]|nr:Gfo/Idh/MocA family oxidoreductase [Glaciibacter sp.]